MAASQAKEIEELKIRISHVERVVILGDGDRLPLAEIVRTLTKTVNDYIAQKDKEEQQKKDEDEKHEAEKKAEAKAKKEQWDKLKWIIVSFAVPVVLVFLGQAFVFFFRIYPILAQLAEQ
jgi:hypothetical protein